MTMVPGGVREAAWAAGSDAPEKTELRVGFIPLMDCASVVMASVLGFDRKHGIRIIPTRERSWASVRDKLVSGALDASHALYGLVYAVHLGLAANGIDPLHDVQVITVPPPQMAAGLRAGGMDGFCVGEPWGHRAVADGTGVSAVTTEEMWPDHPEKVLGATAEFVAAHPNACRALVTAITEAGRWIDASPANRLSRPEARAMGTGSAATGVIGNGAVHARASTTWEKAA